MTHEMAHVIAFTNQKGGVGKTTTAVNVATGLASVGQRVLLIDTDPQGNATTSFGIDIPTRRGSNVYRFIHTQDASNICETMLKGLDILPSSMELVGLEAELGMSEGKEFCLQNALSKLSSKYDFILLDSPPSLSLLTINTLVASSDVIIPLQCEFFALEGLAHLLNTLNVLKTHLGVELNLHGIVLTMFDKRNKLCIQVAKEIKEQFPKTAYNTIIPRNIRLSEAPSHGRPAMLYDTKCMGSVSYMRLVKEMLDRFNINIKDVV